MSAHIGTYMLNKVSQLMEQRGVFAQREREAAQQPVLHIAARSKRYHCNPGEILDVIGPPGHRLLRPRSQSRRPCRVLRGLPVCAELKGNGFSQASASLAPRIAKTAADYRGHRASVIRRGRALTLGDRADRDAGHLANDSIPD